MQQLRSTIPQDLSLLTERGWLAGQPAAFVQRIATLGRWRVYEPQQVIYSAGDDADALYGLAEGAIEITLPLIAEEPVVIYRGEPGFWIGDSAILSKTDRLVTVTAALRCRVFRVPAQAVRALVAEQPEYWPCFYALNHLNNSRSIIALAEVLSLSPRARLARALLRLSDEDGHVAAGQADLARLIGMTRSTLQRAVYDLASLELLATGYRDLRVLDRAGMEALTHEQ